VGGRRDSESRSFHGSIATGSAKSQQGQAQTTPKRKGGRNPSKTMVNGGNARESRRFVPHCEYPNKKAGGNKGGKDNAMCDLEVGTLQVNIAGVALAGLKSANLINLNRKKKKLP